ncbi:MAG TPA: acetate--CoA ligase family protein, partial [Actinomycetota bacterium]|nr:acetate--CoA ligase family protein [Actinomycetota bacterium]
NDCGGERAHLIDVAAETGVPLARISDETRRRIAAQLDPGLPAVNPLDAWGTGRDFEGIFADCMRALLDDPDTGALAFAVDLSGEDLEEGYVDVALAVFPEAMKPTTVLCGLASAMDRAGAARLRDAGIPVLESMTTGVAAIGHLFALRDLRGRPAVRALEPVPVETRDRWRARLDSGEPWTEVDALALIRDYGIPVVAAEPAASEGEAVAAAERIGWLVAVKTEEAAHKSEVDGVRLGLGDADEVAAAHRDLAGRLGPRVTVSAMGPSGTELALGVVHDPQFGPVVLVAAGGVLVEVLGDRRTALPPLDEVRAASLIGRLSVRSLLNGVRGRPAADVGAVARALVRLSALALDLGDRIEALDVNPLLAGPDGCVAIDALVIPRGSSPDDV